ncbi:HAD family hydrolase [Aquabacter sp. L1I39]|uniref:HAD family hydrolase n=1 Tax=Aquabacter sp. L1I39 TaxID=2820278 RepID=UPI001ADB461B|nr:HAD family hydrolase [Aquabacter sp. L1I39]QTL04945.1 HAD family hydrolase [Aquabacter sp. L1I39]
MIPISRASQDVDFVTFDLFETLLLFPLSGSAQMWEMVGTSIGMADFAPLRGAAEAEALRRAEADGRFTISHDEIYECLDLPAAPREFAKRTELLYEAALWHPHPDVRELYVQWATEGRAAIIADTPHGAAFIAGLLSRLGLPEAPLFLASEVGLPKAGGRLFVEVAQRLGVPPGRILHVGSREQEDLRPAREAGFLTQAVDARDDVFTGAQGAAALSYGFRRLGPQPSRAPLASIGFDLLGPLYCAFLRWVEWHARINAIDALVFFPGVGHCLEHLVPSLGAASLPRRAILTASRESLALATVSDRNFDERVALLIAEADGGSVSEALECLGIAVPSAQVMADLGLGEDVIVGVEHHPLVRRFFNAYRWPILAAARRSRRELFQDLIGQGIEPGSRIALVAADWDGSLQEAFELALESALEMEVYGYSLCLLDTPETRRRQARMHLKAMLWRESVGGPKLDLLARGRLEAELLFLAPDLRLPASMAGRSDPPPRSRMDRAQRDLVARGVGAGVEAFARLFNSFVAATGYEPEPLDIAAPFLDRLANLKQPADLVRAHLCSGASDTKTPGSAGSSDPAQMRGLG